MPNIKLLEKNLRELIAAGEVVERPSSVVKELVENSIDAGADFIEVEIRGSGLKLIRVTDNGCGIANEQIETAFLRHATSKISCEKDLFEIKSLGFRGEALAAISAVSKVKLITKTRQADFATEFLICGGENGELSETGAPDGTTFFVGDLFYNTPARMKFLKSDAHEANVVQSIVEQQALAHPEIAFSFIKEGKLIFKTQNDGSLFSSIYMILPKDISENLIEVKKSEQRKINVEGYIIKPEGARKSRAFQYSFINGRYVKNKTIISAVEQAYADVLMHKKFPVFVLNIEMPFDEIDVNVHPSKIEVKFSNEKEIFHAVYYAVKSALSSVTTSFGYQNSSESLQINRQTQPIEIQQKSKDIQDETIVTQTLLSETTVQTGTTFKPKNDDGFGMSKLFSFASENESNDSFLSSNKTSFKTNDNSLSIDPTSYYETKQEVVGITELHEQDKILEDVVESEQQVSAQPVSVEILGEAFETYIICGTKEKLIFVDKHAAHERFLYDRLLEDNKQKNRQVMLEPVIVSLSKKEKQALFEKKQLVEQTGFLIDDFGENEVSVREIPVFLNISCVKDTVQELAQKLCLPKTNLSFEKEEWLLSSIACRAAIKSGHKTSENELIYIVEKLISEHGVKYCPHGRPVMFEMTKHELEKRFGRIQ